MSTIGDNIKRIREATIIQKPMMKTDLARKAGVSDAAVSYIERGIGSPTLAVLQKIARALNVSLGTLVAERKGGE